MYTISVARPAESEGLDWHAAEVVLPPVRVEWSACLTRVAPAAFLRQLHRFLLKRPAPHQSTPPGMDKEIVAECLEPCSLYLVLCLAVQLQSVPRLQRLSGPASVC